MVEQKYYTPAPEDTRIGFQFEQRKWIKKSLFSSDFTSFTIVEPDDLHNLIIRIENNPDTIRVPYLTADQIEAEGWVKQINPAYFVRERNGFKYQLTAFHDEAQAMETNCPRCHVIIRINPDPWVIDHFQVFRGTIRCINDLRSISKLIGI